MPTAKFSIPVEGVIQRVVKRKPATGEITLDLKPFSNLITDFGINRINTWDESTHIPRSIGHEGSGNDAGLAVGTGSATPSPSDTSLDNFLYIQKNTDDDEQGTVSVNSDWSYGYRRAFYTFDEGEATGNLTELGLIVEHNSNNDVEDGTTTTRQLFKDENGDPTTITKLEDEELIITYEIRLYNDLRATSNVSSGTIEINGTNHDWELGPINMLQGSNGNASQLWTGRSYAFRNPMDFDPPCYASNHSGLSLYPLDWNELKTNWPGEVGDDDDTIGGTIEFVTENGINYRKHTAIVFPSSGNFSEGVGMIAFGARGDITERRQRSGFAIFFNPQVPKTEDEEFTVSILYTFERFEGTT